MMEIRNHQFLPLDKPLDRESLANAMTAYLLIGGMDCQNCALQVRNCLLSLKGVLAAYVELEQGLAAAAFDPQSVNSEKLVSAITNAKVEDHDFKAYLIKQMPAINIV